MELTEIEKIWREYDKKLSINTRINKEILKKMLLSKPSKRLNWIKISAGYNALTPLIFGIVLLAVDIHFNINTRFFIGLSLFLSVLAVTYARDLKYFMMLRKIELSMPVLSIKKAIVELEKFKIKTNMVKYLLMPLAITGCLLMMVQKFTFNPSLYTMMPLILIILVYLSSFYFTFKHSKEQFRKLNGEIDGIILLEAE